MFNGFSFISSDFNFESIICLVISGHKPALPMPVCPASVSISTTSQLKKSKRRLRIILERQCTQRRSKNGITCFYRPLPLVKFGFDFSYFHPGFIETICNNVITIIVSLSYSLVNLLSMVSKNMCPFADLHNQDY